MIVVFGSLNADLIFDVHDIPQPGQTLLARSFRMEAGGKGANQAVAAARDGARVTMVGAVGSDSLRDIAMHNLKNAGADFRVRVSASPTGCASIMIDSVGRNTIAVALGANADARSEQIDDELLRSSRIVLLQMENSPEQIASVLRRAKSAGVFSILNLAPAIRLPNDVLGLCDLIVVNEDEAQALAGWLQCGATAKELNKKLGVDVLRTLGGHGAEAATGVGTFHVPALPIDVVDTTAAGDCFVGVLASELDRGSTLREAMIRAATASAIACSRKGSQSSLPLREDTDNLMLQNAS
jgi:ribokinase